MLERLVYRSQATHKLGSLHLFNLMVQCRKRNLSLGITGHLLYTEEIFVQCIEGPSGSIDALWKSLQRDERHNSLELLSRGPVDERQFADWAMAFSSYAHFDKYDIPGFFPLDAQGLSSAAARYAQWGFQPLPAENDHAAPPEKSGSLTGGAQKLGPLVP
jgi:hypothetical protein